MDSLKKVKLLEMTNLLNDLNNCLIPICYHAGEIIEYWDRLDITGNQYADLQDDLSILLRTVTSSSLTVRVNDDAVDISSLKQMSEDGIPFENWQILLNKEGAIHPDGVENDIHTIWFMNNEGFSKWVSSIEPFNSENNILRQHRATRILVCGFEHAFGGPALAIDNINAQAIPENWPLKYEGPDEDAVKRQVHILSHDGALLSPSPFLLSWGDIDSDIAQPFRFLSGKSLVTCLTQEFYDTKRIVLKGTRRLELPLAIDSDLIPSASDLNKLWKAVQWVYEERSEVRAALITDRLSLDLSNGQSLLAGACKFINDALTQSIEQYKFVIQDRKDAYAKELRELLKDVQHQAGLFSEKIRSIMNSLLRDVLAALLLISLGLFSRVGKSKEVLESDEANLLFKALAFYLAISLFLQVFIHLRDLYLTNKELRYWTKATRTQIGIDEIKKYLSDPIKDRRWSFYGMLTILSLIYIILSFMSWNFQYLLKTSGIL